MFSVPLALTPLGAQTNDYWQLRPSVEFGQDFKLRRGLWFRPTLKVGVDQTVDGRYSTLDAVFDGAPAGVAPFQIRHAADSTVGDIALGFTIVDDKGTSARFGYNGQYGATSHEQGWQVKVVVPF